MLSALQEATIRRYYYANHAELGAHLATFLDAYNFAKRLETLKGLTPFEHVVQCWTNEPDRFKNNPTHHFPGLNT